MDSTMQTFQLTVAALLRHGLAAHSHSVVTTVEANCIRTASFGTVGERAGRLANALADLGVGRGTRVGTLCWNTQEHLEAYLAIPAMGAVLHTLNCRLSDEQLAYIVNHAEDEVLIVEAALVPVLDRIRSKLTTVRATVIIGTHAGQELGQNGALDYEDLLAAQEPTYVWPDVNELEAAVICYTSGTTGNPKGVVYSHRSLVLHAFAVRGELSVRPVDRLLAIVPMFHVNGWGLPYIGWMAGADVLLPGRHLNPERLGDVITWQRPTVSVGVPTIWNDLLRHAEQVSVDFSSLRTVAVGGSAVPASLIERFQTRHGVEIIQAWGMTEISPIGALAHPPKRVAPRDEIAWRGRTGRVIAGVEARIVDELGNVLLPDGKSQGEIQVRGPWVTASYYKDPAPEKFDNGWLRTGDIGTLDSDGFLQISDRAKDIIKSGGEWISSVELENHLCAHPEVSEAAVVGVPDERWEERPLAAVRVTDGAETTPEELAAFLRDRVASWWVPERWAFVDGVPKTSVGKYDKKRLRQQFADQELVVVQLAPSR